MEPPWSVLDELVVWIEASMPTTCPLRSTSGPPLLPGLIAASVWIAGYAVVLPCPSEPTSTGRFRALTMPLVTVDSRPNGDPIATTPWPTARSEDLPIVAGVRPETPSALITAVSVSGSVPRILAFADDPSLNDTEMLPELPAIATTWLLVRISPSELRMMPDPEPASWGPATSIFTTDGSTCSATCSTEPLAAGCFGVSTTCEVVRVAKGMAESEPFEPHSFQAAAPATPAAPPTSRDVATTEAANAERPLRRVVVVPPGGVGVGPPAGGIGYGDVYGGGAVGLSPGGGTEGVSVMTRR